MAFTTAPATTASWGSIGVAKRRFSAMRPSSHPVWWASPANSGLVRMSFRASTLCLVSPWIVRSSSAEASRSRAESRVVPETNTWPICESAYGCTWPMGPIEKYPSTPAGALPRLGLKFRTSIEPVVGLKPSAGSSTVIRAATQWHSGARFAAPRSRGPAPAGSAP